MIRKILLVLICFMGLIIFVSTLHGQGSKKTITLPNGAVVLDLNGEWDSLKENYGDWGGYGTFSDVIKITQQGSSFVAIQMKGTAWMAPGSEAVRGELDKSGFKKVTIMTYGGGPLDSNGKISDDGNKMVFDHPGKIRLTLTRK